MSLTETKSINQTDWARVALVLVAGCAAAGHIGKVPVALPVVAADLHLGLKDAASLTAVYSLVSAMAGLLIALSGRKIAASPARKSG